jgi:mannose-6-phosphate isomerase-like protein (cupin superfamily)
VRPVPASGSNSAGLPAGVEVYSFPVDGAAVRRAAGDAGTSPLRPSNATYKLGVVRPHSAFTPHAHGGEHFVLSLGYAACGLYDTATDATLQVRLGPGTLIRIPALLPHSFANRAGTPLLILAANTGFGIDHEDYAITAAAAENRSGPELDYPALAKALRALENAPPAGPLTRRERLAHRLRRLAARLEVTR